MEWQPIESAPHEKKVLLWQAVFVAPHNAAADMSRASCV